MDYKRSFMDNHQSILQDDPELIYELEFAAVQSFEATEKVSLSDRLLSSLAVLIGSGSACEFKSMLQTALDLGLKPEEAREVVYQSIDYVGLGKARPFLKVMNRVFEKNDISLPLGNASTVTFENRLVKGNQKQAELFGDQMLDSWNSCLPIRKNMTLFLASNCFGDVYTRKVLDNRARELITFCFIYALGGADPQAIAHAGANMKAGNSREYLYAVVEANVFAVGYPRSLNALACIDEAFQSRKLSETE